MSKIFHSTKKRAEIHRLSSTTNGKREFSLLGSIDIAIHNMTAEDAIIYDGVSGRGFRGFSLPDADIQKRDQVRVGEKIFAVRSVQEFVQFGSFPHKKIILEEIQEKS